MTLTQMQIPKDLKWALYGAAKDEIVYEATRSRLFH